MTTVFARTEHFIRQNDIIFDFFTNLPAILAYPIENWSKVQEGDQREISRSSTQVNL